MPCHGAGNGHVTGPVTYIFLGCEIPRSSLQFQEPIHDVELDRVSAARHRRSGNTTKMPLPIAQRLLVVGVPFHGRFQFGIGALGHLQQPRGVFDFQCLEAHNTVRRSKGDNTSHFSSLTFGCSAQYSMDDLIFASVDFPAIGLKSQSPLMWHMREYQMRVTINWLS